MIELRNESELEFTDVSSEEYREYTFSNGLGLTIPNPAWLNVSASGGHRLLDSDGICYYIQPKEGWVIEWKVKEDAPHFVK